MSRKHPVLYTSWARPLDLSNPLPKACKKAEPVWSPAHEEEAIAQRAKIVGEREGYMQRLQEKR